MATPARKLESLVAQSPLVFRGRVLQVGASNVRQIEGGANTATVVVDQVLHGNDASRGLAGRQITAVFEGKNTDIPGADVSTTFFSRGLAFAENVAVRVAEHVPATADLAQKVLDLSRDAALQPLRDRIRSAVLIVAARVVSLRALERRTELPSEHDPDWWIATVLVLSIVRGKESRKEIDVLFASSDDIAWYKAPKLHAGQSAVLLLHPVDAKRGPKGIEGRVYEITDPNDLQPFEHLDQIKAVMVKPKRG